MTGYGSAKQTNNGILINVEVKTLNSKFLDVNLRCPRVYSENELEIRNAISDILERGKVALSIEVQNETETVLKQKYNKPLFTKYYQQLDDLAEAVGASKEDIFRTALNSPDVVINSNPEEETGADFSELKELIVNALEQCDQFRAKEGEVLKSKLCNYIGNISDALDEVLLLDPKRVEKIRDRIKGNLQKFVDEENLDQNRLEQEIVYYIEKLDITEEKVRLRNHLNHFSEVIDSEQSVGKKLGFISQEIGREINTIGSKANDSDIQRQVVTMKEELEKIKEQLLNVL